MINIGQYLDVFIHYETDVTIPKRLSEAVNHRRTYNAMTKRRTKRENDIQNATQR